MYDHYLQINKNIYTDTIEVNGSITYMLGHKIPRSFEGKTVFDGAWVEWTWDGQTLLAQTSPHALIPLYYSLSPNSISISTSITLLLEKTTTSAQLDWKGLSVMLRMGNFINDRTPFNNIKVLPPHTRLTWSAKVIQIETDSYPESSLLEITREKAIEYYIDLMTASIRRRLPTEKFVLPISAGRDSRHILLELISQGYTPDKLITSTHYRDSSSIEVDIAKKIATRVKVPHEVIAAPNDQVDAQCGVTQTTDYCVMDHYWTPNIVNALSSYEIVYDGLNGNVLFGRTASRLELYNLFIFDRIEELADRLLAKNDIVLKRILKDEFYEMIPRSMAVEELSEELERHQKRINPLLSYLYWNRTVRRISYYTYRMLRNPIIYCPLDDLDIVNFAFSLPPEISNDPTLQKDALRKKYPAFADIQFEEEVDSSIIQFKNTYQGLKYLKMAVLHKRSKIVDMNFILSRSMIATTFGNSDWLSWWIEPAIYLLQLEHLLRSKKNF